MSWFDKIISNLPEVTGPQQRRLSFKEKIKWTGIVLVLFFIYGAQKIAQFFAINQIRVYLEDIQNDVLEGSHRLQEVRRKRCEGEGAVGLSYCDRAVFHPR